MLHFLYPEKAHLATVDETWVGSKRRKDNDNISHGQILCSSSLIVYALKLCIFLA